MQNETLSLSVIVENHQTKSLEGTVACLTFGAANSGAQFPAHYAPIVQSAVKLGFVPVWSSHTSFIRLNPAGGALTGQESLPGVLCAHSVHSGGVYCKRPKEYFSSLASASEVSTQLARHTREVRCEAAGKNCVRLHATNAVDALRALAVVYPGYGKVYNELADAIIDNERSDNAQDIAAANAAIDTPAQEIAPKKTSKKSKK